MDRQRCWSAWQDRAASQVLRCEWLNNRIRSGVLQISVRPILLTGAIVETPVDIGTLIERTPGIRGGRPCIAGTGVSVMRIVGWYNLGLTPEEIAADYPHLSLAQVHAALAYYHANRTEIDDDVAAENASYEALELQYETSRTS